MAETEARLWSIMKDKTRALRALERAWKKMPRGSGTAIRIAKIHASAGRVEEERAILEEALKRDSEDKQAHFAMAMFLISKLDGDWDQPAILRHLGSSFSVNDLAFEERYVMGQFLFATGDIDRAKEIFSEIDRRAPREFRRIPPKRDNTITERLGVYHGAVQSVHVGYFFLRSGAYADNIFAHRSAFEEAEADDIEFGNQVFFRLRFNRRGPVAVSVHRKEFGWARTVAEMTDETVAEEQAEAA